MIDLLLYWEGLSAPAYARRFRTAALISDFSPVLRRIAVVVARSVETNFDVGGRPPWQPLQASTVADKVRQGFTAPYAILVRSGDLFASATDESSYIIGRQELIAKPDVHYWIYHQTGTAKMPQRVIMNLQRADQRAIGRLFDEFIMDHLERSGLRQRGNVIFVGGGGIGP